MDSFLFALVAVFLLSLGGKDQLLVARFTARLGQRKSLLALGMLVSAVTAAIMAYAGASISAMLPGSARLMLIAIALLIASVELFWPVRLREPKEPTRSLGAIGFVLLYRQIGDAARFAVFAFAAATALAPLAWLGGALGGAGAILFGWSMGADLETRIPLKKTRFTLGVLTALIAIWAGLSARNLI